MLLPAGEIALHLGRLGVRPGDTVVLCSDALRDATLAATALARVGHASYAVLHGGFTTWTDERRPESKEFPTAIPTAYLTGGCADSFTVDTDGVRAALSQAGTIMLDVRPADYFSGRKSDEARPGHIPGAVNRESALDLVPGTEFWQATDRLRNAYAGLGVTPDKTVIVYCRTGHQASQTCFLLRHLLGFQRVRWYDGSWSAWAARKDLPVVAEK